MNAVREVVSVDTQTKQSDQSELLNPSFADQKPLDDNDNEPTWTCRPPDWRDDNEDL